MAIVTESSNRVSELQISRMPEGGFVVMDGTSPYRDGNFRSHRFASTSIEEALKYCKRKLETDHEEARK